MKKLFQKILQKVFKKVVNKAVSDNNVEMPEVEPITIPCDSPKKDTLKFFIQLVISILTAIAASLGTTSCVSHL